MCFRALLMKEEALQKRRKEAEELLQWHKRLKEEEIKISELEKAANSIPRNIPDTPKILTGAQLNKFWRNITGSNITKFDDSKKFTMSQRDLEQFFSDARKIFREVSDVQPILSQKNKSNFTDYVSDFEIVSSIKNLDSVIDSVSTSFVNQNDILTANEKKDSKINMRNLEFNFSTMKNFTESDLENTPNDVTNQYSNLLTLDNKSPNLDVIPLSEHCPILGESNILSEIEVEADSETKTLLDLNKSITENLLEKIKSEIGKITESDETSAMISDIQESVHDILSEKFSIQPEIQSNVISEMSDSSFVQDNTVNLSMVKLVSDIQLSENSISMKHKSSQISAASNAKSVEDISDKISSCKPHQKENTKKKSDFRISLDTEFDGEIKSNIKALEPIESETNKITSEIIPDDKTNDILNDYKTSESTISLNIRTSENIDNEMLPIIAPEIKFQISDIKELSTKLDSSQTFYISEDKIWQPESQNGSLIETEMTQTLSNSKKNFNEIDSVALKDISNSFFTSDIIINENKPSLESSLSKIDYDSDKLSVNSHSNDSAIIPQNSGINSKIKELSKIKKYEIDVSAKSTTQDNSKSSTSVLEDLNERSSKLEFRLKNVEIKILNPVSLDISVNINNEESSNEIGEDVQDYRSINSQQITEIQEIKSKETTENLKFEVDEKLANLEISSKIIEYKSSNNENNLSSKLFINEQNDKSFKNKITENVFLKSVEKLPAETSKDEQIQKIFKNSVKSTIFDNEEMTSNKEHIENLYSKSKTDHQNKNSSKRDIYCPSIENKHAEISAKSNEKLTEEMLSLKVLNKEETFKFAKLQTSNENKISSFMLMNEEIKNEQKQILKSFGKSVEDVLIKYRSNEETERSPKTDSYNSEFETEIDTNRTENSSNLEESSPDLNLYLGDLVSDSNSSSSSKLIVNIGTIKGSPKSKSSSNRDVQNPSGVSHIDVRKRVSEILADSTTVSRGDKSPRMQDFYITTYDVMSPSPGNSPEIASPTDEIDHEENKNISCHKSFFGEEAEELLRKQLEIEQEIKRLEQQQKESAPYCFMRQIPNKPPPPYKPPPVSIIPTVTTVIPSESRQVKTYIQKASSILYDDYEKGKLSEKSHPNIGDRINSYKFVFDLCKEIALDLQKKTKIEIIGPSWMQLKPRLKPIEINKKIKRDSLEIIMNRNVQHLLGFQTNNRKDNLIVRWSRKKRDHVDEILVLEAQTEEADWTNYDKDELTVKNNLTNEILDLLVSETAQIMNEIIWKKRKNEIL